MELVSHLRHHDVAGVAVQVEDSQVEDRDFVDFIGTEEVLGEVLDRPHVGAEGLEGSEFGSGGLDIAELTGWSVGGDREEA